MSHEKMNVTDVWVNADSFEVVLHLNLRVKNKKKRFKVRQYI